MVIAIHVGNSILMRAFIENIDITPMKLQKLIYFTYQMYLKETDIPLFDERFETWKYGPVISSVYNVETTMQVKKKNITLKRQINKR